MNSLYGRSVFFVADAERALSFYTDRLGFSVDWNYREQGRAFAAQVSLLGFDLILNQTEAATEARAGHGRVFIGLDDAQVDGFRRHLAEKGIEPAVIHWGAPTLVIRDLDGNELFFWLPESLRSELQPRPEGA